MPLLTNRVIDEDRINIKIKENCLEKPFAKESVHYSL